LLRVFDGSKYKGLFNNANGFFTLDLITAYGDDTEPIMSETLPTMVKLSSATSQPIFGGFSVFIIMLFDGVTLTALPTLCNFIPQKSIDTKIYI